MKNRAKQTKETIHTGKTLIFAIAGILLIALAAGPAISDIVLSTISYSAPNTPNLRITLVNQDPDPAQPGDYVDVRFRIDNIGNKPAENVTLTILPESPLSVSFNEQIKNIGGLGGFQTGSDAIIVKFQLQVDDTARQGNGQVRIKYTVSPTAPEITTSSFNVSIKPSEATVMLNSVIFDPAIISPGQASDVAVTIQNIAKLSVRDVRVLLDTSSTTLPLASVESSNEKVIESLAAGQQTTLKFKMMAQPGATPDLYKLPIIINYKDGTGKNYTRTYTTGAIVGITPGISVEVQSSTIYSQGQIGTVSFKVVNKDVGQVKFLEINVNPSENYEILSNEKIYVGKIDSDDYSNADFKIKATKVTNHTVNMPLTLTFQDANNNKYTQQTTIPLKVLSKKELGLGDGIGTWVYILIAAVLIAGAYLLYRRTRKKR